jgi:hypothetical protein
VKEVVRRPCGTGGRPGPKTSTIAAIQASDCIRGVATGPPTSRPRRACTKMVIGLTLAKACSQPGMVSTGTNTPLAKTSGKIHMPLAACVDSGSRMVSPTNAEMQQNASPIRTTRPRPTTASAAVPWKRKPTSTPTTVMSRTWNTVLTVSEATLPASTAERAMGNDRTAANRRRRRLGQPRPLPGTARPLCRRGQRQGQRPARRRFLADPLPCRLGQDQPGARLERADPCQDGAGQGAPARRP